MSPYHNRSPPWLPKYIPERIIYYCVCTITARVLHKQHLLSSLRSSSSCLHLLPRILVHYTYASITCVRRHFLCYMWPIQLAFLRSTKRRMFLPPWYYVGLLFFLFHTIRPTDLLQPSSAPHFKTFKYFLFVFRSVQVQRYTCLFLKQHFVSTIKVFLCISISLLKGSNNLQLGRKNFNPLYTSIRKPRLCGNFQHIIWKFKRSKTCHELHILQKEITAYAVCVWASWLTTITTTNIYKTTGTSAQQI
jgi:hypothetical protein